MGLKWLVDLLDLRNVEGLGVAQRGGYLALTH